MASGRGWRILPALFVAAMALAGGGPAQAERVGVNSAVNPDAQGTLPGGQTRRLVIGQDIVHNEHIVTDTGGQTQILFVDGSAMSVGPNSDLTIDEFVYNPNGGKGALTMSAARGVLRFVGGELSKEANAVSLRTPSATIGIRGGVFIASLGPNGELDVTFVFGRGLTVAGAGVTQIITRPGFAVHVAQAGAAPSAPFRASDAALAKVLARLSGRAGANGGATRTLTDATVANSGIGQAISGNFVGSVQQEQQNTGAGLQHWQGVFVPNPYTQQVQTIVNSPDEPQPQTGENNNNQTNNNQNNNTTPPQPTPVVVTVTGAALSTNGPATRQGYIDQGRRARIPYSDGTITYPDGTSPQDGVFAASAGIRSATLSPLTPGMTTQVTGTVNTGGAATATASGTATMTADGTFFYANLTSPSSGGGAPQREFVFGGTPVSEAFYAPQPTHQIYAFQVQPDAALGTDAKTQTVPFLPSFAGGTMANASVSPLYVVTPRNTAFGAYNGANPRTLSPHWMQASLAIDGAGANQSSALAVSVGTFQTDNTGHVVSAGQLRGTVTNSATAPVMSVASNAATLPGGTGDALFGGNTISGFVLDQNKYRHGNLHQANAEVSSLRPNATVTTPYAFNQPVTATALPDGVGASRTALNESGYFGGIMQSQSHTFAVAGVTAVQTDPRTGTVRAKFAGADPFTPVRSGVDAIVLNFGSARSTDGNSAFIDNNNYAAVERTNLPAQIYTRTGEVSVARRAFQDAPSAMVTSGAVPNDTLLPPGVSYCQCQFLQWGYWSASLERGTAVNPSIKDASQINTWVAGQKTVFLPASGVGTYSGAAVGTVANNGASYLAAGGFNSTYNFGTNQGAVTISNFDNRTFSGTVTGGRGNFYSGGLSGSGVQGSVNGSFYGPNAAETGGNFAVQGIGSSPGYLASGIFTASRH